MRKLVAIVIASAAILAVVYVVRTPSATDAAIAAARERGQQQSKVPAHDVSLDVTDSGTAPPTTAREESHPVTVPLTVEEHQEAACFALAKRREGRDQAALDAEPKDPTWAFSMEQKLREHMAQRLQGSQIEVIRIDCKTSFCALEAQVLAPEAGNALDEAINAIPGASWNDFTATSGSVSDESGKTLHSVQLRRKHFKVETRDTPDDEQAQAACMARAIEKERRARAARDAQPKDAIWADPMEQLLRQYLTTQLVKQPVEHIDIDCRTTFCRIKGTGRTNDAFLAFQKSAQTAAAEPWSNLYVGESRGSGNGETWDQEFFLYRNDTR